MERTADFTFIPERFWSEHVSCGRLSKLFSVRMVQGVMYFNPRKVIAGGSYALKFAKGKNPVPYVEVESDSSLSKTGVVKRYRPCDVVVHAKTHGHEVIPNIQEADPQDLAAEMLRINIQKERYILALDEERDSLRMLKEAQASVVEVAKRGGGRIQKMLLTGAEVVEHSLKLDEVFICGIYFLIKEGRVHYIGQSVNVFGRVAQHLIDKGFNGVAFVKCAKDELDFLESLYIHTLRPEGNGNLTNGAKNAPIGLEDLLEIVGKAA